MCVCYRIAHSNTCCCVRADTRHACVFPWNLLSMQAVSSPQGYTILGNGDWNGQPILKDGTHNIVASVDACEVKCMQYLLLSTC